MDHDPFQLQVEYLLHNGLAKKYRKSEGNVKALKGGLHFARHIQYNVTHQERFYVRYTAYDVMHVIHCILYETVCLLKHLNTNIGLHSRIGALLLHFPEMPHIAVAESTFDRILIDRKTASYKKALDISRALLLRYHPDVSKGRNDVLALMFDMNSLWEKFVYISLKRHKAPNTIITGQTTKFFWKPLNGRRSKMRPDILIIHGGIRAVLDTKWKNLQGYHPSPDDLRQMYVYHEYYEAGKVALVYPGAESSSSRGRYLDKHDVAKATDKECSVISLGVEANMKAWQMNIYKEVATWLSFCMNSPTPLR